MRIWPVRAKAGRSSLRLTLRLRVMLKRGIGPQGTAVNSRERWFEPSRKPYEIEMGTEIKLTMPSGEPD
jgi:hypothetical protein